MFTLTDIRDIAIQIERNGEHTYRMAGKNISDPDLAQMFEWMADEERRHAKWFESFESDVPVPAEHREMEAMGRSLLQEMIESQTFSLARDRLENIEHIGELLTQSIAFEHDTILFYEMLRGFIEDTKAIQQLDVIISEEREHVDQLARMKATIGSSETSAPDAL